MGAEKGSRGTPGRFPGLRVGPSVGRNPAYSGATAADFHRLPQLSRNGYWRPVSKVRVLNGATRLRQCSPIANGCQRAAAAASTAIPPPPSFPPCLRHSRSLRRAHSAQPVIASEAWQSRWGYGHHCQHSNPAPLPPFPTSPVIPAKERHPCVGRGGNPENPGDTVAFHSGWFSPVGAGLRPAPTPVGNGGAPIKPSETERYSGDTRPLRVRTPVLYTVPHVRQKAHGHGPTPDTGQSKIGSLEVQDSRCAPAQHHGQK